MENKENMIIVETPEELERIGLDNFVMLPEEDTNVRFHITNDSCADWAVRKINEEREELDRLQKLALEQIDAINTKVLAAQNRYKSKTAYLTHCLAEYFQTVPHKTTKTTEKYRLLSGTLTLKKGGMKAAVNEEKLVPWLKQNGMTDFVKVKESAAWGDLKKRLTFSNGVAMLEDTGEIVEGVTVDEQPDTFHVEK